MLRGGALLLFTSLVNTGLAVGCVCPAATVLAEFPSEVPADVCCLNYSGSAFGHVRWSVFTNETNLQILDLSNCNIVSVEAAGRQASPLRTVYLQDNRLTVLPREFLAFQPRLTEVDLSGNMIRDLPDGFLQDSDSLRRLYLQGNWLNFLPASVLQKPTLQNLELDENPWDCSCSFLAGLEESRRDNRTTQLEELVGNLTCVFPKNLSGRVVWLVRPSDVCRPAGLTALFIALPLLILSTLVLCWCCGRKKETPMFRASQKRASSSGCNVPNNRNKQTGAHNKGLGNERNQHSKRQDSVRDIYEDVEIKLGSAESLHRGSAPEADGVSRSDVDSVSVSEVMKDSADREKAYMTQATEYYSLVPGIELDDSDHGDYENVDLS